MTADNKKSWPNLLAQLKYTAHPNQSQIIADLSAAVGAEVATLRGLVIEADRNLSRMADQLPALTRRIDVALNGEEDAAPAPLLIDVLGQLEKVRADGGGLPLLVQLKNLDEALAREVNSPTHMGELVLPPLEKAEQMLRAARDAWKTDPNTGGVMPDHQITLRVIADALTQPRPVPTEQFVGERMTVDKALWEMLWKNDARYRYLRDDAQYSDDPLGPQVLDMSEYRQGHSAGILAEEELDEAVDAAIAANADEEAEPE